MGVYPCPSHMKLKEIAKNNLTEFKECSNILFVQIKNPYKRISQEGIQL